ncbi:hypothetical protein COU18_03120 [Candidatus Kaiserbacteria bacterium CG10_big_fil_rev_8_21_14_0_10_51_14]|uniref:Uncharacterized protein n=1 Tax=Candidatus Kaiserbacteria bacterium CG10_big_fil_rev_8_21_14_0_10_51_14 TaxID=1974610 RepID=A0A2H0UB58_9BACT|nr:MAG: hypothetical protein COU18_03120 [Candidatus Kaiserbacteria bacterium CG10_big_fil_rev_8_21_14_0_10_51_14]
MKFVAVCIFVAVITPVAWVSAYSYDDSVVIEIGDGVPPPPQTPNPPPSSGGSSPGGGENGSSPSSSGGGEGGGSQGANGAGSTIQGGSSSGSDTSSGGTSSSSSSDDPASALFELLVAEGAVSGGALQSGASNSGTGSGAPSTNEHASGSSETTVNAAKLRAAIRGKSSLRDLLDTYSSGYRTGTYRLSGRGLGLLGASAVMEDANIDELTFGATKFEMVYRSRGYVLGFIPKTFPLRIAVNPQASITSDRVVLTLPWYRFILRKLFKISTLRAEIDSLVIGDVAQDGDTPADVQARLFDSISFSLQQKVGAIRVN